MRFQHPHAVISNASSLVMPLTSPLLIELNTNHAEH